MIRNMSQLKRAMKLLAKFKEEVEDYRQLYSGYEADILTSALVDDIHRLEYEIEEYSILQNSTLEEAIKGLLQEPVLLDRIGELLAKIRISSGLTQTELANILGWQQSNVSRFESENYSSQTISKVVEYASALGVWLNVTPSTSQVSTKVSYVNIENLHLSDIFFANVDQTQPSYRSLSSDLSIGNVGSSVDKKQQLNSTLI